MLMPIGLTLIYIGTLFFYSGLESRLNKKLDFPKEGIGTVDLVYIKDGKEITYTALILGDKKVKGE